MMKWLIETSLRLRVLVTAAAIVLMIVGVQKTGTTPLDVFPEFAPPLVEIQTEAPGLSAEEVESLVTVPLENALNGTSWLETMRSKSVLGLSSVVLIFQDNTDLNAARQLIQERLVIAEESLPAVAHHPVILPPLSSTSRVMKIGVWSDVLSQMDLTVLATWTIRPRLMAVPGVANVAIWGQRDRQLQVLVEPDRLRANNMTLDEVVRAVQDATQIGAGGFVDTPNQRLSITHISAIKTAEDLAAIPVTFRNGISLRVGDVADVIEGSPPPIGDAVINDGPGLLLIVEKQPDGNTLEVTRNVEAALDALRPGLKDVHIDSTIFRPATFIEMSLTNLKKTLLISGILVAIILVLFLFESRTVLISVVAMPLSLVTAVLILHYRGETLNTMVIAGLIIAIGQVVDDAIIDVENIMRRLRLNRIAGNPESAFEVVLKASLEVRGAVVFGTLTVVLVVLPIFFLSGLAGTFFRPLALSYVLAIAASLFVALTLTPALALILLPRAADRKAQSPLLVRGLSGLYRGLLPPLLKWPSWAVLFLVILYAATAWMTSRLKENFLPDFKEYDFLMHWVEKPGTSLEAMSRITVEVSKELRSIPGVRNFGAHIGRAEVADEVVGPNFTELWISLDPKVDYAGTLAKIQQVVDGYPGLYRDVLTYLKERIKEVLTGTSASIVIRIYGPDLDVLRAKGKEIADTIQDIPGVADLKVEPQVLVPQVEVAYRTEDAQRFGLTPGAVRVAAATLMKGVRVGQVFDDQKMFDVVVMGTPRVRGNMQTIRELPIDTPSGAQVPLGDVANITIGPTPNTIQREGASRRLDVTCNVRGRDLSSVASEIETRVRQASFDRGYHPEFLGEYAAQQQARNRLLALAGLSLLGILVLLHVEFESVRLTVLLFVTLPFAMVGGVLATFFSGGILSLGSLIGFITVLGVAARNGILLVSHYRHLEQQEGEPFSHALIIRGSTERLAPILMTALTTALALLPVILRGDCPGHEIEHPMAIVIVGGLLTSTVMNLLVMPALYARFGRVAQ